MRRLTPLTLFLVMCLAFPALAQTTNPDHHTPCGAGCEEPVLGDVTFSDGQIHFNVSEPATVRIYFDRHTYGNRSRGGRCVKNGRGRVCHILRRLGKIVIEAPAGETSVPWDGTASGRSFKPGRYRFLASALDKDDGLVSNRVTDTFFVVPR